MTIDFFVVSLQKIYKNMETEICIKCQEVKTLSEFGKKKGKILNRCKKCICLSSKEWYENNKEKAKEWRKNNKEKVKQYDNKVRENCCPYYITANLKKQGFNKEQITPELIEENANIIKVKRIIKKINESIN